MKFDPQNRYAKHPETGEMQPVPEDQDGGKQLYQSQLEVQVVAAPTLPVGRLSTEQIWTERLEKGVATPRQWVFGSTIENKADYWHELEEYMNIKNLRVEVQELEKASKDFQGLVMRLLKAENGTHEHAIIEQDAAKLLNEFPKLIKSFDFSQLPATNQGRLLMGLVVRDNSKGATDEPAGQAGAGAAGAA